MDGMHVITKPELIDILRDYERLRRWRRTRAVWAWFVGLFQRQKPSIEDLDAVQRQQLRGELDRMDMEQPPEEEPDES